MEEWRRRRVRVRENGGGIWNADIWSIRDRSTGMVDVSTTAVTNDDVEDQRFNFKTINQLVTLSAINLFLLLVYYLSTQYAATANPHRYTAGVNKIRTVIKKVTNQQDHLLNAKRVDTERIKLEQVIKDRAEERREVKRWETVCQLDNL